MDAFKELKKLSHHAYCLIGSDAAHSELLSCLEKEHGLSATANPDFFDRHYENFTIDDARELKSIHETRPVRSAGKKIFVLTMNGITVEAQNALLKLLEEPAVYAHFFLIVPSKHLLLPTVKSRLSFIGSAIFDGLKANERDGSDNARKFLKAPPAMRIELIKKLLDDISKERQTKQNAIDFVNDIQAVLYERGGIKKNMRQLEAIETVRKYLNDRSPSLKMLLEYVALHV
ncbi:MAG: polymerase subunit delta [Candidatus Parcubacteria bacterium]|jgi:DNA polymerase III delta prime subunit|nr:polymerase subunit delta [Candidatus Parcubacteria bacterium]